MEDLIIKFIALLLAMGVMYLSYIHIKEMEALEEEALKREEEEMKELKEMAKQWKYERNIIKERENK